MPIAYLGVDGWSLKLSILITRCFVGEEEEERLEINLPFIIQYCLLPSA